MTYSQKYCLVQFLEPTTINTEFTNSSWPPHVTIAGVFALTWNGAVQNELAALATNQPSFTSTTTTITHFGPARDIRVCLVTKTPNLQQLHDAMVSFIETHGGIFNEPHYLGDGFKPHITLSDNNDITPAHVITFTQLALIDMFPNGDHTKRNVIQLFSLAA